MRNLSVQKSFVHKKFLIDIDIYKCIYEIVISSIISREDFKDLIQIMICSFEYNI